MARNLGVLEIPLGMGGLNRSMNPAYLKLGDLEYMTGITIENGVIEKEIGGNVYSQGGSPQILFSSSPRQIRIIPYNNDRYLAINDHVIEEVRINAPANGTSFYTTNSPIAPLATVHSNFVRGFAPTIAGEDKSALFHFNVRIQASFLPTSLSTPIPVQFSNVPAPNPAWSNNTGAQGFPLTGAVHNTRMFVVTRTSIYGSVPGNHGDYTGTGSFFSLVYPGDGAGNLTALLSWRNRLYIFKERGIYTLNDTDNSIANWRIEPITSSTGVLHQMQVVPIDDDVIFLGSDGNFYSLSSVKTLGQVSIPPIFPKHISDFLRSLFIRGQINSTPISGIVRGSDFVVTGSWFAPRRVLSFVAMDINISAFPNGNVVRIDIFFHPGSEPKVLISRRDTRLNDIALDPSGRFRVAMIYHNNNSEIAVVRMDQPETLTYTNEDSAFINLAQFETPDIPFADGMRATLMEVEVFFDGKDSAVDVHNLDLQFILDGVVTDNVSFNVATPPVTGSNSLDVKYTGGRHQFSARERISGSGRHLKIIGRNNTAGQSFRVSRILVKYGPADQR